jgi:hypothetical protein
MAASFFLGGIVQDDPNDLVFRDQLGPISDAGSPKELAFGVEGTTPVTSQSASCRTLLALLATSVVSLAFMLVLVADNCAFGYWRTTRR